MKRLAMASFGVAGLAASVWASLPARPAEKPLVVHEWGTFTVLQDERGEAIGGVNTDDEPVPPFVHGVDTGLIEDGRRYPVPFAKNVPRCDPSITVRLETPVIYFHPPTGFEGTLDVDVQFRGGWLTQFYPDAKVSAPGLQNGVFKYNTLTDHTLGTLAWHHVKLGSSGQGPETTDPVWTAPRQVEAANVTAVNGENERFIFYRGVGHVQTPVRVVRSDDRHRLSVRWEPGHSASATAGPLWLVDVRPDGKVAVRQTLAGATGEAVVDAHFADRDYADGPAALRESIRGALVADGLFADEADGLLNTWDVSYFRRPGLRLFYLVPHDWTDAVLPLQFSSDGRPIPTRVNRVMVGRVELITPEQRKALADIGRGPLSQPAWIDQALARITDQKGAAFRTQWFEALMGGRTLPAGADVQVPADYRAYLNMGRFRNAIVLDELSRRPSTALKAFADAYALMTPRS